MRKMFPFDDVNMKWEQYGLLQSRDIKIILFFVFLTLPDIFDSMLDL